MDEKKHGQCSRCAFQNRFCEHEGGPSPENCSTKLYPDALKKALDHYEDEGIPRFAREASLQESSGYFYDEDGDRYPIKPRVQETIEFCKRMGYQRIGLAFCVGLMREASIVAKMLEAQGLTIISVSCKVGGVDKSFLGIEDAQKTLTTTGFEPMCNPIGQAMVLNEAGTDFNLLLGLCVGHDSMFLKYSESMCSVLAVKDRLMGHNPLGVVNASGTYYNHLLKPLAPPTNKGEDK